MIIRRIGRILRRWRNAIVVRRSGFWNGKWYLAHNPDVAANGRRPLCHYITHGAAERRSPGPAFDAHGYWLLNPSSSPHPLLHYLRQPKSDRHRVPPLGLVALDHPVLSSGWFDPEWYHRQRPVAPGVHPYVDYVQYGEAQGIPPSPVLDISAFAGQIPEDLPTPCALAWLIDQELISALRPPVVSGSNPTGADVIVPRSGRSPASTLSVLAAVHAYYADLTPEVLGLLANLPSGGTIAVVVPDADRVQSTHDLIDEILGTSARRHVLVVENRGRNFGPLVCDLAPLIGEHDVFVHVHTKKSVYSGRQQDEWRQHLYSTVVGTRGLVDTILGLFDDDPSIGVVYPSAFTGVPHWAHHWLGNTGVGRDLYRRLGLDPELVSGIVDYPVGGMFWARTSALRPLWQAGFTIEEFPVEPIAADGTIAHAIERSILDVAKNEGFHVVELDMAMPQWRRDWSARRTLPSRSQVEAEIERAMARSDLVTVDLFDTLALRPSLSPSTLQTLAARRAADNRGLDAKALLSCRLEAENAARQIVSGDVDIDDIRAAAPSEMRAGVATMIDAEVALEADMCIPRAWLIDLLRSYRRSGRTILLMSDTYLPRSCIDGLLGRIGAVDVFDGVLVSNEVRARKDSGAMWDLVESTYAVPRDRWMHLGDNEHSDVQIPRDRGIDGIHVPSPHGTADYLGIDRRRIDSSRTFGTDFVVGLAATGAFSDGQSWWEDASPARRFGWAGIGPLLWTYITWLIQHPATRDANHMLFIARDGHLPWTALQRLSPFLPNFLPPAHYFLTSRRSALSAAQGRGLRLDLLLGGNTWVGTARDLVRHRIGLSLPADVRLDERLELPADLDRVTALLEPYAEHIVTRGDVDLRSLEHYLRHLSVMSDESIVLADLGYSATIQRCLEAVLPHTFTGLYATTTPAARKARGATHGLFGEDLDWPSDDSITMEHGLLLEVIWAAEHGQVNRIESTSQGLVARLRDQDDFSEPDRRELCDIRTSALDFCREVIERFGPDLLDEPVDPSASLMPFAHLVSGQVDWANDVLRNLTVEGDFTGVGISHVRRNRR